jgi:hypothetical protein
MKFQNTIAQVREESTMISREGNGRLAVIVSTCYSKGKSSYGVQFWTPEMIAGGTSCNTDRSVSIFVDTL